MQWSGLTDAFRDKPKRRAPGDFIFAPLGGIMDDLLPILVTEDATFFTLMLLVTEFEEAKIGNKNYKRIL